MEVLKGLSLKGKSYTDAIDIIVESKEMGVYLVKGAEIVFTVAAEGGRGSGLKSGVESCAGHLGQKSQSISVDMDAATNAHGYGISLGKYYAWQKLLQYGETVTVDDCKDMSMSELHGLYGARKPHARRQACRTRKPPARKPCARTKPTRATRAD